MRYMRTLTASHAGMVIISSSGSGQYMHSISVSLAVRTQRERVSLTSGDNNGLISSGWADLLGPNIQTLDRDETEWYVAPIDTAG